MRFLTDQDVYALTSQLLRELGHDVVTTAEIGLSRAADTELLARAHQELDRLYWPAKLAEAQLLFDKDNEQDAVEALHETLSLNPRCADAWFLLGRIARSRNLKNLARVCHAAVVYEFVYFAIALVIAIPQRFEALGETGGTTLATVFESFLAGELTVP